MPYGKLLDVFFSLHNPTRCGPALYAALAAAANPAHAAAAIADIERRFNVKAPPRRPCHAR